MPAFNTIPSDKLFRLIGVPKGPVIIDVQTDADFALWTKALSDRPNAVLRRYDRLNHLMQEGDGPSRPEEYARPVHVAEQVIVDVAEWLNTPAR